MTTATLPYPHRSSPMLFLFALLSMSIAAVVYTQHAKSSHAEQTWNATSIQAHFDAGKCTPKIYVCKNLDIKVEFCEVKPGLSIGLIKGNTIAQTLTGYAGRTKYWANRCK